MWTGCADLVAGDRVASALPVLAAISMLLDWLTSGGILPFNPAASVRGPKYSVKRGKTPVLTAAEARTLLDSIDTGTLIGLRDRALIAVMVYSFARVGAAIGMHVADYFVEGRKAWFRLCEKGGKRHEVPAHHNAVDYVDAYIAAADIAGEKKTALFRSIERHRNLTGRPLEARNTLDMIKRGPTPSTSLTPSAPIPSGHPASPPTSKMAALSSTLSKSPITTVQKPPSFTTALATRSPSTRSSGS
jgi:site-specific recombinase XerC